uniref:BHLH domain-containing protein n=1 Tax=Plectus sambesii TaxID=2011161 RepID=A0A914UTI3_9BILA
MDRSSLKMRERPTVVRKRTRAIANDRERRRMQQMSLAFKLLRACLSDWIPEETKLSKKDTLLLATLKIRYLTDQMNGNYQEAHNALEELTQKWPWQHRAMFPLEISARSTLKEQGVEFQMRSCWEQSVQVQAVYDDFSTTEIKLFSRMQYPNS